MRAAGVETWHDASELAVMGLFEVLRHLPRLLRLRAEFRQRALALAAGRAGRHRCTRLQPRRGTLVQAARRADRALRQPVGLGLGARSVPRRSATAPTGSCACSRWNRRSMPATAWTRASSAIRWPMPCPPCTPTATPRARSWACPRRARAGGVAGQPARRDRTAGRGLLRGRLARVRASAGPARGGARGQRALPGDAAGAAVAFGAAGAAVAPARRPGARGAGRRRRGPARLRHRDPGRPCCRSGRWWWAIGSRR